MSMYVVLNLTVLCADDENCYEVAERKKVVFCTDHELTHTNRQSTSKTAEKRPSDREQTHLLSQVKTSAIWLLT